MFKKSLSIFLCLLMIVSMVPFSGLSAAAEESEQTFSSGSVNFTYNSELKKLTISGTGAISDYSSIEDSWGTHKSDVEEIVVENGITAIGSYAFYNCSNLKTIIISESVESIAASILRGCSSLETIVTPFIGEGYKTSDSIQQYPLGYFFGTSIFNDSEATEQSYYGTSTSSLTNTTYYIPTSLKAVTVTAAPVLYGAFYNCKNIKEITISDSVNTISRFALFGCSTLESLTLPFVGTSVKTSSDTYQYPLGYIFGTNTYSGAVSTSQVYYGSSTSSTTSTTYYIPSTLKNITVTGGTIPYGAFYNCSKLTNVTIGNAVTRISNYAFFGCSSLVKMELPFVGLNAEKTASTTYQYPFGYIFGTSSYSGGTSTSQTYHSSSISSTTSSSYYIPTTLREVIINGGNILYGAFSNCSKLTAITIPENTEIISANAFSGCSSLTSIAIPSSVKTIESNAFSSCSALKTVEISDINGWIDIDFANNTSNPVYYAKNIMIDGTPLNTITIEEGIEAIKPYTFINCSGLEEITLPTSLKTIGLSAFSGCSSVKEIVVPDSITEIGESAFNGCSALEALTVPYIGRYADNVEKDKLPFGSIFGTTSYTNSVKTTENYIMASGEKGAASYYIPSGLKAVTVIGGEVPYGAFYNCNTLETINIPATTETIPDYAFYGCTNLSNVLIPDSVDSIGIEAFANCTSIKTIRVPEKVQSISSRVFFNCNCLEKIAFLNKEILLSDIMPMINASTDVYGYDYNHNKLFAEDSGHKFVELSNYLCDNEKHCLSFYNTTVLKDNNCTERGLSESVCLLCMQTESFETPIIPDEHDFVKTEIDSHHTENNIYAYVCSRCQFVKPTECEHISIHTPPVTQNFSNAYPESAHNYSNNYSNTWTYNAPVTALQLEIKFNSSTQTESNYDYIYIYKTDGTEIARYSGTSLAGKTITVPGSGFKIKLTSDGSNTNYGFKIDSIVGTISEAVDIEEISFASHPTVSETVYSPSILSASSCTQKGVTEYTCETCGIKYTSNDIECVPHQFTKQIISTAYKATSATCTEMATYYYACLVCGERSEFTFEYGQPLGHSWNSGEITTSATCTTTGVKTYRCYTCSETKTESVDALGHSWNSGEITTPATCVNTGIKTFTCLRCYEEKTEIIPVDEMAHNYVRTEIDAHHTENGIYADACSLCGYVKPVIKQETNTTTKTFTNSYPESAHNYSNNYSYTWTYNAPETAESVTIKFNSSTQTESRCDYIYIYTLSGTQIGIYSGTALAGKTVTVTGSGFKIKLTSDGSSTYYGFKIDSITGLVRTTNTSNETHVDLGNTGYTLRVKTAASCTANGITEYTCSVCGLKYNESNLPALGHNVITVPAVESTCSKAGLTEGKKCNRCGIITVAQQTVAKKAHTEVTIPAVASTCTKTGLTAGKKCSVCGTITVVQKTVAKKSHTYKDILVKATLSKNGSITPTCSVCGAKGSATAITRPKTIKLSSTSVVYNGNVQSPTVIIKDSNGSTLEKDTDYTVKYASGRKNVGEYIVTVTFKGNYSGTKTLSFKIVPAETEITSVSGDSCAFTVNWKKHSSQVSGYQLQYSTSGDFSSAKTVTTDGSKTVTKTVSKLKASTKYYVRVRTYKAVGDSKYYSNWSAKKSVTTKPAVEIKIKSSSAALCVGGTKTLSYSTYPTKVTVTWKSSDTSVAKVSSDGKVTAVKKGTATITASFKNGGKTYKATCKITVKNPSIKLNKSKISLEKGETLTLSATTFPLNAKVSWSSSNSKVAKVSSSGKVTGVKNGSATITATMKYSGKTYTATCKVKVASLLDELADGFSAQLIVPTNGGMNSYCQVKYINHTGKKIKIEDGHVYANGKGCSNSKLFDNSEVLEDGYYMVITYYRDLFVEDYYKTKDMYLDSSSEAHTSIIVNGKRVYISFDTEGNTIFGYKWSDIGVY